MKENPIDKDKTAEEPGLLPYAHHVGSPVIKPIDKGRVKGNAMAAMSQQANRQLAQIQQQIQLLADQARKIQQRVEVSHRIYEAEMGFSPLVGHRYFLYEKADGSTLLSMLSPRDWGRKKPYANFISEVELLADHTWELIDAADEQ